MKSPRPKRLRKERVPWEAAVASTLDTAKKAERKAPRTDGDCVYVPSHGRHQMGVNSGVQWDTLQVPSALLNVAIVLRDLQV
jgi:hypothetical protein